MPDPTPDTGPLGDDTEPSTGDSGDRASGSSQRTPEAPKPGAEPAGAPAGSGGMPRMLGDFRILHEIGRGGMGVVYEAEQVSLGRRVALKVLPHEVGGDPRRLRRFRREARSAAQLHHTNIVPVFGVGQHEDTHFYIMQLIQGEGLDKVIHALRRARKVSEPTAPGRFASATQSANTEAADFSFGTPGDEGHSPVSRAASQLAESLLRGRLGTESSSADPDAPTSPPRTEDASPSDPDAPTSPDLSEILPGPPATGAGTTDEPVDRGAARRDSVYFGLVARIGQQAAEALEYAHGQGIFHRDIKPSNLLLDAKGTIWVTDFGLARCTSAAEGSQSKDLVGTIRYMPPERFEGSEGDARGDVYALGLTLYELLALRPAFHAADQRTLVKKITEERPTPLRKIDPQIPRNLAVIVHKAIAREPSHRYPNAGMLAEDLKRYLERRPIKARPVSFLGRFYLWCRRNPGLAALNIVAATLTTLVAIISTVAAVLYNDMYHEASMLARAYKHERDSLEAERQSRVAAEGQVTALERLARRAVEDAAAERRRADRLLYLDDMRRAQQAWDDPDGPAATVAAALRAHRAARPEQRDLAWRLLWARLHGVARPLDLPGPSLALSVSPDGALIRLGHRGVGFWDRSDGAQRLAFDLGRPWPPGAVALSPDGATVARSEVLGTLVHLVNTRSGAPGPVLEMAAPVGDLTFSPNGRFLAVITLDHHAAVYEVANGREVGDVELASPHYRCALLSNDGRTLWLGNHPDVGRISTYDIGQGDPRELPRARGVVLALAGTSDGSWVAAGTSSGQLLRFDALTRERAEAVFHRSPILALAFSPDSHSLAAGAKDGQILLVDPPDLTLHTRLKAHEHPVNVLAFTREGRGLVSGDESGVANVWDLDRPDGARPLDPSGGNVRAFALSADGRHLAIIGRRARILETSDSRLVREFDARDSCAVALSPDGALLATGHEDGSVRIWDAATGALRTTIPGPSEGDYTREASRYAMRSPRYFRRVACLSFSPDGSLLAVGHGPRETLIADYSQVVRVWDVPAARLSRSLVVGNTVSAVWFDPSGTSLRASVHDGTIRSWELPSFRPLPTGMYPARVTAAAVSPDGATLAAGLHDGRVLIRDLATGVDRHQLAAHTGSVLGLAFTPGSPTLLTTGAPDGCVKLWDLATGREVLSLPQPGGASQVALDARGTHVLVNGPDGGRAWPAPELAEIDRLPPRALDRASHAEAPALAVAPPDTPASLSADQRGACCGRFRLDSGVELSIAPLADGLALIPPDAPPIPLVPLSPSELLDPHHGLLVRYPPDQPPPYQHLTLHQDGRAQPAKRISPVR